MQMSFTREKILFTATRAEEQKEVFTGRDGWVAVVEFVKNTSRQQVEGRMGAAWAKKRRFLG